MSYTYLLHLALILIVSKIFSIWSGEAKLPKVLGSIIAGLVLGPSVLGIIEDTTFIEQMAKLGVIVIMFSAGLGVSLKQIKSVFKSSFMVALLGVLTPIGFGILSMMLYNGCYNIEALFVGIIFTATSVAISVETLKELGKLDTKVGNAILAAAVIDDVLGVIALSFGMAASGEDFDIWMTLIKIAMFFLLAILSGIVVAKAFKWYVARFDKDMRRFTIFSFVYCLLMAYVSEVYFGLSAIIGAFIAGLVISGNAEEGYIQSKVEVLEYLIFSPIFFASIGLQVSISGFGWHTLLLAGIFILVAVLSKIIGCGVGALTCGYKFKDSFKIGIGMVGRGEVVLILTHKAMEMGVITNNTFTAIIITVIFCAVVTPILLKLSYRSEIKNEKLENK